jgi:hypothetical protein
MEGDACIPGLEGMYFIPSIGKGVLIIFDEYFTSNIYPGPSQPSNRALPPSSPTAQPRAKY